MPITYTSRKGFTYTLCQGVSKTGTPRYYFAREPQDTPLEQIPAGYVISESLNGIVSLAKDRPAQIRPEELATVEAALRPSALLAAISARKMSPVDRCVKANRSQKTEDCVPLPEPGAPMRMTIIGSPR